MGTINLCGAASPQRAAARAKKRRARFWLALGGFVCQAACGHGGHAPEPVAAKALDAAGGCTAGTFVSSRGICVPTQWHCSPLYYAAGAADGCDCDCGAPDPDCDEPAAPRYCYGEGQPIAVAHCRLCGAAQATAP